MQPRLFPTLAALLALLCSSIAGAQSWPDRPVRFIVSFPPGSSPDIVLRLLTDRLPAALGQPVLLENRPGGNSIIGARIAATAAPDGYTFYFASGTSITSHTFTVKDLPYDPLRDFMPVAMYAKTHHLLLAPSTLRANTLPELVAMDKANPGSVSFASFGPRTSSGLIGEYVNKVTGMRMVQVPYASGAGGQMIQDLIAERVHVSFDTLSVAEPHIKAGTVKILAITSGKRLPGLANVPTVSEAYPGFETSGWFGIVTRTGTSPEVVKRMNRAVDGVLNDPAVLKRLTDTGWIVSGADTPEGFGAFWRADFEKWRKITEAIGLKPE